MNAKLSVFLIYFKAIICLSLYNLHEYNFKSGHHYTSLPRNKNDGRKK